MRLDQPVTALNLFKQGLDRFPGEVTLICGIARIYEVCTHCAILIVAMVSCLSKKKEPIVQHNCQVIKNELCCFSLSLMQSRKRYTDTKVVSGEPYLFKWLITLVRSCLPMMHRSKSTLSSGPDVVHVAMSSLYVFHRTKTAQVADSPLVGLNSKIVYLSMLSLFALSVTVSFLVLREQLECECFLV